MQNRWNPYGKNCYYAICGSRPALPLAFFHEGWHLLTWLLRLHLLVSVLEDRCFVDHFTPADASMYYPKCLHQVMGSAQKRCWNFLKKACTEAVDGDPEKHKRVWQHIAKQDNVMTKLRAAKHGAALITVLKSEAVTCFKGPGRNERRSIKARAEAQKAHPKVKPYHGDGQQHEVGVRLLFVSVPGAPPLCARPPPRPPRGRGGWRAPRSR